MASGRVISTMHCFVVSDQMSHDDGQLVSQISRDGREALASETYEASLP